jgi:hypothetical protein
MKAACKSQSPGHKHSRASRQTPSTLEYVGSDGLRKSRVACSPRGGRRCGNMRLKAPARRAHEGRQWQRPPVSRRVSRVVNLRALRRFARNARKARVWHKLMEFAKTEFLSALRDEAARKER